MTKPSPPSKLKASTRRHRFRHSCFVILSSFVIRISSFAQFPDPGATPTPPIDTSKKAPAEWVAQLGSEKVAEREQASAALLALGAKARDAVNAGLDSKDTEVQSLARELWKTLRWDVIPGAEKDIAPFLNPPAESWQNHNLWVGFKQKYGMQTLRLIAEFHDGGMEKTGYQEALLVLVGFTPPEETAGFIKSADPAMRKEYEQLLDVLHPGNNGLMFAGVMVRLWSALGNDEKAYEHGRDAAFVNAWAISDYDTLVAACAAAVKRAGLFDKIKQASLKDLAAETNPDKLCAKLGFYAALMSGLGKKELIGPLCKAVAGRTAGAGGNSLRRAVESLLAAGMPSLGVKILAGAAGVNALYMRSSLESKTGDKTAAGADWDAAMKIIDTAGRNEAKKSYWMELGYLMHDWHDPRAESFFGKVFSVPPEQTGFDVEAGFQLGGLMEEQHNDARAIEFYEKGLALADILGDKYSTSTPDGKGIQMFWFSDETPAIREKLKKLKARAPEKNTASSPAPPTAATPPAPEAQKPQPPGLGE